MGRKTWDSIPLAFRPLRNRLNVVISRTLTSRDVPAQVKVFPDFHDGMKYLSSPEVASGIETIWNVGGSSMYELGLDHPALHRLYLTRIYGAYECDTFFPSIDWSLLTTTEDADVPREIQEESGVRYKFEVYERAVYSDAGDNKN